MPTRYLIVGQGVAGIAAAEAIRTADAGRHRRQPARFDWPHTFPLDHGESGIVACQTCHPVQVQDYTCYGCHEHQPDEIAEKHLDEGISDFQDCVSCHPTGQEDEAEGGNRGDD